MILKIYNHGICIESSLCTSEVEFYSISAVIWRQIFLKPCCHFRYIQCLQSILEIGFDINPQSLNKVYFRVKTRLPNDIIIFLIVHLLCFIELRCPHAIFSNNIVRLEMGWRSAVLTWLTNERAGPGRKSVTAEQTLAVPRLPGLSSPKYFATNL